MDLATAAVSVLGPVVTKALTDVWQDWRTRKKAPRGASWDEQCDIQEIDNRDGVVNLTYQPTINLHYASAPAVVSGRFVFEESLLDVADECLYEHEQVVVLVIIDHGTGRSFFFQFEFGGYEITVWNGDYSLYAFVVDPRTDDVLGEGYPIWRDLRNPNPITFEGEGLVELNVCVFDVSDDY